MNCRSSLACVAAIAATAISLHAQTPAAKSLNSRFLGYELNKFTRTAIGVTRQGTPIPAFVSKGDFDIELDRARVLLIGGLDGDTESIETTLAALEWFQHEFSASQFRERWLVSAVPCANPDGALKGTSDNQSGGDPTIGYPPNPKAYNDPRNPEAQYLWRWIGMHAPDIVVDLRGGGPHAVKSAPGGLNRSSQIAAGAATERTLSENDLAAALSSTPASGVAPIPAIQVTCGGRDGKSILMDLLRRFERNRMNVPSPARIELRNRVARSPLRVALQLEERYGNHLKTVMYQPALSLVARARLSDLTGNADHRTSVEKIVSPYVDGSQSPFGKRNSGSVLSGHLIFGELARATGNKAYIPLVKAAADYGFDAEGKAKESMPFHNEMSDAVFMSCPILAQAGVLTGDSKYFDLCLKHLKFMQNHCLRKDGIYRHSPLDEGAWGRGNGFPALGLAWTLSWLPEDFDGRYDILAAYRAHLGALARHQDPNGMWHQVVDHPESYREMTSTCMITFAMIRGIRNHWLNPEGFEPVVQRAWRAIKTRIANDGSLVDVCTGTGKQKNLRAYFDRAAILGPDERGGAMAFMVATEMAAWEKEKAGK